LSIVEEDCLGVPNRRPSFENNLLFISNKLL
jgi:hypothetical protein